MINRSDALKRDIDIFLKLTGMKPTNFGKQALNDSGFYTKLKNGRRLYGETEDRVRRFMVHYAERKAA